MQVSGHIRKRERMDGRLCYQIIIELPVDPVTVKRNRKYKTKTYSLNKHRNNSILHSMPLPYS